MFKIETIDHLVLRTTRLDKMLAFYCGVLGCVIERELLEEGLTQLRAGNALIDIVVVDSPLGRVGGGPPTKRENNLDHFCLRLEKISEQAITDYLNKHNVEISEFQKRYGSEGYGLSVYLNDPEGNIVELRSSL